MLLWCSPIIEYDRCQLILQAFPNHVPNDAGSTLSPPSCYLGLQIGGYKSTCLVSPSKEGRRFNAFPEELFFSEVLQGTENGITTKVRYRIAGS